MHAIWFTPTTARRALQQIRPVAERVCALYRALEVRQRSSIESDQRVDSGYFAILARYAARVEELRRHGVRLRDPRCGALDFPARRAGRPVCLCWRVGEPALRFWREPGDHELERRPLEGDDGSWDEDAPARR